MAKKIRNEISSYLSIDIDFGFHVHLYKRLKSPLKNYRSAPLSLVESGQNSLIEAESGHHSLVIEEDLDEGRKQENI